MANLYHQHDGSRVLDFISNSIGALADAIALLIRQLFAACCSRIVGKRSNALHDALDVLLGEKSQVFGYGLLECKLIACRAPSSP